MHSFFIWGFCIVCPCIALWNTLRNIRDFHHFRLTRPQVVVFSLINWLVMLTLMTVMVLLFSEDAWQYVPFAPFSSREGFHQWLKSLRDDWDMVKLSFMAVVIIFSSATLMGYAVKALLHPDEKQSRRDAWLYALRAVFLLALLGVYYYFTDLD